MKCLAGMFLETCPHGPTKFSQYSLVWASMLGGAVGLKRGYQVGITSLIDSLPPGPAKAVQAAGYCRDAGFFGIHDLLWR